MYRLEFKRIKTEYKVDFSSKKNRNTQRHESGGQVIVGKEEKGFGNYCLYVGEFDKAVENGKTQILKAIVSELDWGWMLLMHKP